MAGAVWSLAACLAINAAGLTHPGPSRHMGEMEYIKGLPGLRGSIAL